MISPAIAGAQSPELALPRGRRLSLPRRRGRLSAVGFSEVLDRLEGVRRRGNRAMALCPAHGDRHHPSLSVGEGKDGRVLLNCFAGCEFSEVAAALGLRPEQLMPLRDRRPWVPRPQRPNREAGARADLDRLLQRHRLPTTEELGRDLRLLGHLLLAGPAGLKVTRSFDADRIQTFPLRMIFLATKELARQGTPRRWFSPVALASVIDDHGGEGYARALGVYMWCKTAIGMVRGEGGRYGR